MKHLATATLTLAIGAVVLTGCGSSDTSNGDGTSSSSVPHAQQWNPGDTSEPTTTPPAPAADLSPAAAGAGVDRSSPDSTARTALTIWYSWNPNTDRGPNDAVARSAPLLAPAYADKLTGSTSVIGAGAQWNSWAAQHATVAATVDASPEEVPPESPTEAFRVFEVTQTVYTPQGVALDTLHKTVGTHLKRGDKGWEVASVDER